MIAKIKGDVYFCSIGNQLCGTDKNVSNGKT